MDSLQQTDGLIKASMEASSSESNKHSQALLNLSLTLEDLIDLRQKLFKRIQKATRLLLGKDASTAAAVKRAMKNEFLMKRMKAHAIRLKIRQQVRDMLLMSVSIKRRTSREKKGKHIPPFSSSLANIPIFSQMLRSDNRRRTQSHARPLESRLLLDATMPCARTSSLIPAKDTIPAQPYPLS